MCPYGCMADKLVWKIDTTLQTHAATGDHTVIGTGKKNTWKSDKQWCVEWPWTKLECEELEAKYSKNSEYEQVHIPVSLSLRPYVFSTTIQLSALRKVP